MRLHSYFFTDSGDKFKLDPSIISSSTARNVHLQLQITVDIYYVANVIEFTDESVVPYYTKIPFSNYFKDQNEKLRVGVFKSGVLNKWINKGNRIKDLYLKDFFYYNPRTETILMGQCNVLCMLQYTP